MRLLKGLDLLNFTTFTSNDFSSQCILMPFRWPWHVILLKGPLWLLWEQKQMIFKKIFNCRNMTFYAPEFYIQFVRSGGFLDNSLKLIDHAERTGGVYSLMYYNKSFCPSSSYDKHENYFHAGSTTGWTYLSSLTRPNRPQALRRLPTAWPRRSTWAGGSRCLWSMLTCSKCGIVTQRFKTKLFG